MNEEYQELENIIESLHCNLDLCWKIRLLKKHKSVDDLVRSLNTCFGPYNRKYSTEIVEHMKENQLLDKYLHAK
jgi:hypothetical protein